jgi:hypothetical protein
MLTHKTLFTRFFTHLLLGSLFLGFAFNPVFLPIVFGKACLQTRQFAPQGIEFDAEFYQLTTNIDGLLVEHSGWGMVDVTFMGSPDVLYFNLVRQGEWIIQNMPVLSSQGFDSMQTQSFQFDLGLPDGVQAPPMEMTIMLSTEVFPVPPVFPQVVECQSLEYAINSGHQGLLIKQQPAGGQVMLGGPPDPTAIVGPSIWNQDCGKNECVPAAVSNALRFLNDHHDLKIDSDLISIESLKPALGWTTTGCKLDDWPRRKKRYLRQHNIPITTEVVGERSIQRVIDAMNAGCAVEMNVFGHTALVTAVAKLPENNMYSVEVAHDTEQGSDPPQNSHGTRFETMNYESSSGRIKGVSWGRKVHSFVIECRHQE